MAHKKNSQETPVGSASMQNDYQSEEDVRTLTRAAEVVADRGRASMAMKKFKKTQVGMDRLLNVLGRKRS